jgi:hypothetical protein
LYGERPWRGQECESLVQWATRTRVEGLRLNGQGYLGGGLKGKSLGEAGGVVGLDLKISCALKDGRILLHPPTSIKVLRGSGGGGRERGPWGRAR